MTAQYGVAIGIAFVVLVTAVAFLIGAKAESNIRRFPGEDHEQFLGERKP